MTKSRTKFVVLATARTGTSWLRTLLNQHPEIRCFGEILHPKPAGRSPVDGEKYRDQDDGASFIDRLYSGEYGLKTRCVGFKLFYQHGLSGHSQSVWEYLGADSEIKIVHVLRVNQLEAYVSLKKARAYGRWEARAGTHSRPDPDPGPITIDPTDFERYLARLADMQTRALSFFGSHEMYNLSYEEMVQHRNQSLERLMKFLGLPARPWLEKIEDRTEKQETVPMHRRISNFGELAEEYAGTPLASYFQR